MSIWNYITIGATLLLTFLVLIQTRGAGLGAGLGGGGEVHTERRGSDKTIHQITVITAFVFAASILVGIVAK